MPKPVSYPFPIRAVLPVNSAFGKRPLYGDLHTGVDFNSTTGANLNSPVRAAGAGTVVESYNGNSAGMSNWAKLRGTMVAIDHGDGWRTRYHMLVPNSNVPKGTVVRAGDVIGRLGSSGSSTTGPHLHFELWKDGVAINPVGQLSYNPAAFSAATSKPFDNTIEEDMIKISSPARGSAIIGAGYVRHLSGAEEIQQADAIVSKTVTGNDRQFDIWVSLATGGAAAATYPSDSDRAVIDATSAILKQTKPLTIVRSSASQPTLLPQDGSNVTLTKLQDDADTNSLLRQIASRPATDVDSAAIVKAVTDAIAAQNITAEVDVEAVAAATAKAVEGAIANRWRS